MTKRIVSPLAGLLTAIFWLLHVYCVQRFLPLVFSALPATGGDTGSHLWPVVVLRDYGLPHFNLRVWNPGNYAGEPLLVHYFPLPFVLMALASYVMPVGLAFNLGSFLPVLALPPAVWWSARRLAPALGGTVEQGKIFGALFAILSMGVLYNGGNTMWGGNFFSVLSGQFAHQYALVFFFLFLGVLPGALATGRNLSLAAVYFAAVVLSHAYVAVFLPVVFLAAAALFGGGWSSARLGRLAAIGGIGTVLSAWFWWPLVDNSKWTTPYGFVWAFRDVFAEVVDVAMAPSVVLAAAGVVACCFSPLLVKRSARGLAFWGLEIAVGGLAYAVFDKLGLVDVRAFPQAQYALAAFAAWVLSGMIVTSAAPLRLAATVTALGLAFVQYKLVEPQLKQLVGWAEWNYSGWTTKPAYLSLKALSLEIRGSFDDPRVAFEHDAAGGASGSERVFELLPFFANRSTTDGVYMQSTILAPMTFYQQAALSKDPSCPFPEYGCSPLDVAKGVTLARLLGVDTFILSSAAAVEAAEKSPELKLQLSAKPWNVYKLVPPSPAYAEVLTAPPEVINPSTWRARFWDWYQTYQPTSPWLVVARPGETLDGAGFEPKAGRCEPKVHVTFGEIKLSTPCPGRFHVLKFAFHDSWRASGGEKLWLVSPGFIGLVPKSGDVVLRFGQSPSWLFAGWLSVAGALALLAAGLKALWPRRRA